MMRSWLGITLRAWRSAPGRYCCRGRHHDNRICGKSSPPFPIRASCLPCGDHFDLSVWSANNKAHGTQRHRTSLVMDRRSGPDWRNGLISRCKQRSKKIFQNQRCLAQLWPLIADIHARRLRVESTSSPINEPHRSAPGQLRPTNSLNWAGFSGRSILAII
jgi:hypothetical protein